MEQKNPKGSPAKKTPAIVAKTDKPKKESSAKPRVSASPASNKAEKPLPIKAKASTPKKTASPRPRAVAAHPAPAPEVSPEPFALTPPPEKAPEKKALGPTVRLNVEVPEDFQDRLKIHAIKTKSTVKDIVRELIDKNIPRYDA